MAVAADYLIHAASLTSQSAQSITADVDLRRAVSACYYALFHALTQSAAERWSGPEQRNRFARLFNHGKMKDASGSLAARQKKRMGSSPPAREAQIADDLALIADAFVYLQQVRHEADYDMERPWSAIEVMDIFVTADRAITAWEQVKNTVLAGEYLLDLIGSNR